MEQEEKRNLADIVDEYKGPDEWDPPDPYGDIVYSLNQGDLVIKLRDRFSTFEDNLLSLIDDRQAFEDSELFEEYGDEYSYETSYGIQNYLSDLEESSFLSSSEIDEQEFRAMIASEESESFEIIREAAEESDAEITAEPEKRDEANHEFKGEPFNMLYEEDVSSGFLVQLAVGLLLR